MRRISLAILVLAFVCFGCRHGAFCSQGTVPCVCRPDPGTPPIICINPNTMEPIAGHEQPHASRGLQHWVHFFLATGNYDLQIQCDALENIDHDRQGHAWGRVKLDAALGPHQYTAINASQRKGTDPTIIIDP